jgi:hypothetical protein
VLTKPSNKVLSAIASLQNDQNFSVIRDWLTESLESLYVNGSTTKDDVVVRWNQGAAQVVRDLLEKCESASEVIRKSR